MAWFRRDRPESPGRPVRGFTAAATLVDLTDDEAGRREAAKQKKRPLAWQRDAWRYYDEVDAVRAYGRWMSDTQARMRTFPAILSDDPDQPPVPATEADGVSASDVSLALSIVERLRSEDGDRNEIQRVAGLNVAIAGEGWMVGTDENPEFVTAENPTGEQWRVCSIEELAVLSDNRWAIRPFDNAREDQMEILDKDTTTLVRMYRRHGRWRDWPDSAMRPANVICEELLLATQSIMASLVSRLPAGILPIPDDVEIEEDSDEEQENEADGMDPFTRKLLKHLSAPKGDPRSAASMVPFVMRMPAELIAKMPKDGIWQVARQIDPELGARIDQLIKRLAMAFDMPPELLLGRQDINHWNAWLIDEDGVRLHVEPVTQLYCDAWTAKILQPRLALAGVANAERWVVHWDPTDVMSHPDRKANALEGYNASPPVVKKHTLVTALGLSEDDMPDDAELAEILEWRSRTSSASGDPAAAEGTTKGPPGQTHIAASAAPPRRPGISEALASIERRLARDLLLESDNALRRVVDRAESRVRSAANRGKSKAVVEAHAAIENLAVAIGRDGVAALGLSDDDLFAGGLGALGTKFTGWTDRARREAVAAMRAEGIEPTDAQIAEYEAAGRAHADEGLATLQAGLAAAAAVLLFGQAAPTIATLEGEWDSTLAASPRLVHDALREAGGGLPEGVPDSVGSLFESQDFLSFVGIVDGVSAEGFLWVVGEPERPFEPHQALDGVSFTSWEDEALAADEDWVGVTYYAPQDHEGCQCDAVPDIAVEALIVDEPTEE